METFLSANPGLRSRFPRKIDFPDYSAAEMLDIFQSMAKSAAYLVEPLAIDAIVAHLNGLESHKPQDFANGREVRNLFEAVMSAQANRVAKLADIDEASLLTITAADVTLVCGSELLPA